MTDRSDKKLLANLNAIILSCLERRTVRSLPQIADEIDAIARSFGNPDEYHKLDKRTIKKHLDDLKDDHKIQHQDEGYFIAQEWRGDQPKAYIFVVTQYPEKKQRGKHYQKILVDQIQADFRKGEHLGLTLVSAEIVMGHEYDVIVIAYGPNTNLGTFVMDYLLTNELVAKTHTVMVWPSKFDQMNEEMGGGQEGATSPEPDPTEQPVGPGEL
jgi:hypothetical protein